MKPFFALVACLIAVSCRRPTASAKHFPRRSGSKNRTCLDSRWWARLLCLLRQLATPRPMRPPAQLAANKVEIRHDPFCFLASLPIRPSPARAITSSSWPRRLTGVIGARTLFVHAHFGRDKPDGTFAAPTAGTNILARYVAVYSISTTAISLPVTPIIEFLFLPARNG